MSSPNSEARPEADQELPKGRHEWPLWEIFIRGQHGLSHRHVGSLHAPDAEMAIRNAREFVAHDVNRHIVKRLAEVEAVATPAAG